MTAASSNRWGHFARYHLPMLLYAVIILGLSSIPYLRTPRMRLIAVDKLLHFAEYAVFALLVFRSFSHWSKGLSLRSAIVFSVLFVTVFAFTDELFQSLIPGRFADPYDFAVDLGGAFAVLAFCWYLSARKRVDKRS